MTQRLRGISDEEATGMAKEIFDVSNQFHVRAAPQSQSVIPQLAAQYRRDRQFAWLLK